MRTERIWLVTLFLAIFVPRIAAAGSKAAGFTCTQVMGVSVTGDWFGAGFESGNDDGRWQALTRKHAFVELWGDPKDPVWSEPVVSPCAKNSAKPDRVIFTGVNWQFTTVDQWTAALTKAVRAIKSKYPSVKRIELLTMLRGPGNKTCGNDMTVVAPIVDEAVGKVVAAFGKLVVAAPRFEAPSCEVFTKGGPHFTDDGMAKVANLYASHYLK
jgi:ABC-type Fe3+-hydroxamate transport system substrate-binding protein